MWCCWSRRDPRKCAPPGAAQPLHSSAVDVQWGMLWGSFPEVHNDLLDLPHSEEEIVVLTPLDQLAHLTPVVGFFIVGDEAHHSCVIHKLNDVFGAVFWHTVVGQQCDSFSVERLYFDVE